MIIPQNRLIQNS